MEGNLYNPANQPKDWLITNFVARKQVFQKIFKDLQSGEMKYPEQHYLIQGQRGMGKTTLLLRLKYEVENTTELNKWVIPVFFNEESYDLTSLSNLWEKLLKYLDNLCETGDEYYGKTNEFIGRHDYEKQCFELLTNILRENKKKLIIFFDNFGQLFLDNLKEKEQHRFREILMNCNDIRIVGASAVVIQDLHDYSKPFFEFFKIINLEGLDKKETFQLIAKLQENSTLKIDLEKNKAKIETLAILTGGVIRTIMLIYEVILADEDGTALRDLETILDRITPLYKHRIEDLPVQQRKIIDVIAKRWDAISTKEIAESIREDGKPMATKLISAQLQQLEKNNVIEKKQTNTKNHLYQLKERFFNIWYLMRNGDRLDRRRVMWLTRFLESWYADNGDIEGFIKRHIELLNSGNYYTKSAIMIAEALTYSSKVDFENQANLIRATEGILNEEQKKFLPKISLEKFNRASILYEEKKFNETITLLESIEQTSFKANVLLCCCYLNLKQPQKAIKVIIADNPIKPYLTGLAYLLLQDYSSALKYLEKANDVGIDTEVDVFNLQLNCALGLANEIGKADYDNAIKYYKKAIELEEESGYQGLIDLYTKIGDHENAEKYYLRAIDLGKSGLGRSLIETYVFRINDHKKAIELIDCGQKLNPNDGNYLFYKGFIAFSRNDFEKAEHLFIEAKELFNQNDPEAPNNRGIFAMLSGIYIFNKIKTKAVKIVGEKVLMNIALEFTSKAIIYTWDNQFKEAFEAIHQFINIADTKKDNQDTHIELLLLLLIAKKQYHFTLDLFENEQLNFKDRFKPIYYALMQNLKDEYPNEHLKMGAELEQPVNDILEKIKETAIDYA